MNVTTHNLEETYELAKRFTENLTSSETRRSGACVVLLHGELGSGKTSFVQGIARALGVKEHVTSPTFVIQKNYELGNRPWKRLIHIDAYRFGERESAAPLELETVFADKENIVLIEWPEHLNIKFPGNALRLSLRFVSENEREIVTP